MKRVRIVMSIILIMLFVLLIEVIGQNPNFRYDIVKAIRDVQLELLVTGIFVIILLWLGIEINHRALHDDKTDTDFWRGISTEMIGAFVTTILLGMVVLVFLQYQDIQNRRSDLLAQLSSDEPVWTEEAYRLLRNEGWFTPRILNDGELDGANWSGLDLRGQSLHGLRLKLVKLTSANLNGVDISESNLFNSDLSFASLQNANLENTTLNRSDLRGADLRGTNINNAWFADTNLFEADFSTSGENNTVLDGAIFDRALMSCANFSGASMVGTSLLGASLQNTYLQGANLIDADLSGSNMLGANLRNTQLSDATFNEFAILPDGTSWTPEIDMERFTNPAHPDFWDVTTEYDDYQLYGHCEFVEFVGQIGR